MNNKLVKKKERKKGVSSPGKQSELRIYLPADNPVFFFVSISPTLSRMVFRVWLVNIESGIKTPAMHHLLEGIWNDGRIQFVHILRGFVQFESRAKDRIIDVVTLGRLQVGQLIL